ncbi:hypothetical protein B0I37DRAFT_420083 [Chaetomium sp. MPI-CAGE-AT-0009]|nr:hypothetical protein B0I37DRAFT_420083 [Chaetomium sp. MPI-CAGE-AT-0009]
MIQQHAPETPMPAVQPAYWSHACPLTTAHGEGHIQRLPRSSAQKSSVVCFLGCGQGIDRDTELLNASYQPIALVGGKNLMPERLERWWMECGVCGETKKNFLADHPAVKGQTGDGGCLPEDGQEGGPIGEPAVVRKIGSLGGRFVWEVRGCHSCLCEFTSEAIARNPYGEDVDWVAGRDDAYHGHLEPMVTPPALGVLGDRELKRREWFKL